MAAVATLQVPTYNTLASCPMLPLVNLLQHKLITVKDSLSHSLRTNNEVLKTHLESLRPLLKWNEMVQVANLAVRDAPRGERK